MGGEKGRSIDHLRRMEGEKGMVNRSPTEEWKEKKVGQ